MKEFDFVVIGAGPAGLTLATYLPGSVCVVDAADSIGGCHRVSRSPEGLFAEHAPRVYHGSYVNVKRVLRDIGTSWDELFERIPYSPQIIGGRAWHAQLSATESLWLSVAFAAMALGRVDTTPVAAWARSKNFSEASLEYLDAVCRFSDGAGAERYTVYEFVQGFNQHILQPFYQPRVANDKGLFRIWRQHLETVRKVRFELGARVTRVAGRTVYLPKTSFRARRAVVLCVPPATLARLFPALRPFAAASDYEDYAAMTFHVPKGFLTRRPAGFATGDMGYLFLDALSRHEPYDVLSVALTHKNKKNKTPDRVWADLRRIFGLPRGLKPAAVARSRYRDGAFVHTSQGGFLDDFRIAPGVFTVGCHTGRSANAFTSMESAVQNALAFLGKRRAVALTVVHCLWLAVLLALIYVLGVVV